MTISNRAATEAYLYALNDMHPTERPARLAALADKMAAGAFDRRDLDGFKAIASDDMMAVEVSIFVGLCKVNGVDWRLVTA